MAATPRFVFTITPGHTGTTWLAELLGRHLPDCAAYHERLGWGLFGEQTPDLSHLTRFNAFGNIPAIQSFWRRKADHVLGEPVATYVETSHLLAKCGLMENIERFTSHGPVAILCLTRDPVAIVRSMRRRGDMLNKGDQWLWHLDPDYPRKLLAFEFFEPHGYDGVRAWYVCEMATRAAYYRQLLANTPNLRFIDVRVENLNQAASVRALLAELGVSIDAESIHLPPRRNPGPPGPDNEAADAGMRRLFDGMQFDPERIAAVYIEQGHRLGRAA